MNRKRGIKTLIASGSIFLVGTLTLATYVSFALFQDSFKSTGELPGEVGLRSYFHCGDGTQSDPFVITRPIHFRNLARLQNLGAFGATNPSAQTTDKTLSTYDTDSYYHFQLGYALDDSGTKKVYDYTDAGVASGSYTTTLNMKVYESEPILSIGNEGAPFYGVFDGSGLEVKNLYVDSGPEDVGVFGYTFSGSQVKNVYFTDLTVTDNGWAYKNTSGTYSGVSGLPTLAETSETGSVGYVTGASGSEVTTTLTSSTQTFSDLTGTFKATFPTITGLSDCAYEFRSSSEFLTTSGSASSGSLTISSEALNKLITDGKINASSRLDTRLTIIGRILRNGISYSHVLSSYLITFTYANNTLGFEATLDPGTSGYSHGVNIGFLIGHCDGSATSCYVHNGTIIMNSGTGDITSTAQESETGLIGEIGAALNTDFTPQTSYDAAGDTGVVDFTKMYNTVMPDAASVSQDTSHGSYYFTPNDEDTSTTGVQNRFSTYLRTDAETSHGSDSKVTSGTTVLDFAGRQYIADTDTNKLGLGVFSMVSNKYLATEPYSGLGDFTVTKDSANTFTDFYYTTAEYYDTDNRSSSYPNTSGVEIPVRGWGVESSSNTKMYMARYLPSYADSSTWSPELEKRFDFIFRCDILNSSDYTTELNGKNYFSNVTNSFVQEYFKYKLVDKYGKSISPGNKDFGILLKTVDPDTNVQSPIYSFDSYLTLSAPKLAEDNNDNCYIPSVTATNGNTYPARSIDFGIGQDANSSVESANVTVIASSKSGNGGYVSVYKMDDFTDTTYNAPSTSSSSQNANYPNRRPYVSTYIPGSGLTSDRFAYFDSSSALNNVSSEYELTVSQNATLSAGGNHLFAHTFKLPKGKYFIASPNADTYIYYVCAQGQGEKGNTGSAANTYSELNTISNVDFLSVAPSAEGFTTVAAARCYLSFKSKWSSSSGSLSVASTLTSGIAHTDITPSGTSPTPDNLTYILIDNESRLNTSPSVSYYVSFFGETEITNTYIERTYT